MTNILPVADEVAKLLQDMKFVSPKGTMLNLYRIMFRGRVADQAAKYAAALFKVEGEVVIKDPDGFGIRLQTEQCWNKVTETVAYAVKDITPTSATVYGIFDQHRSALHYQTDDGKTSTVELYSRLHTRHKASFDTISKKVLEPCSETPGSSASK